MAKRKFIYWACEGGVMRFTPRQWKRFLQATIAADDCVSAVDFGAQDVCNLTAVGYINPEVAKDLLEDCE